MGVRRTDLHSSDDYYILMIKLDAHENYMFDLHQHIHGQSDLFGVEWMGVCEIIMRGEQEKSII